MQNMKFKCALIFIVADTKKNGTIFELYNIHNDQKYGACRIVYT